jgi:hypothetical protein
MYYLLSILLEDDPYLVIYTFSAFQLQSQPQKN